MFVYANAAGDRTGLVTTLRGYRFARAFPTLPIRNAILSAMIDDLAADPNAVVQLRLLLANHQTNPFLVDGFDHAFQQYVSNIGGGRMLYVHEAELLAFLANITVVLHYVDRGQYFEQTFNAGRANPTHIYHQALHFSRWQ
jgi:hypothetical protein